VFEHTLHLTELSTFCKFMSNNTTNVGGHFNGFSDLLVLNINFIYHHYGLLLTIACIHIVICSIILCIVHTWFVSYGL